MQRLYIKTLHETDAKMICKNDTQNWKKIHKNIKIL